MTAPTDKTGGPAWPVPPFGTGDPCDGLTTSHDGMSLRDWFAGQALAGILATDAHPDVDPSGPIDFALAASNAYKGADAMLTERAKKGTM